MNNLSIVQEAAIGSFRSSFTDMFTMEFPHLIATLLPPELGEPLWRVWILGDELTYEFSTMGEALDFCCDEARMV